MKSHTITWEEWNEADMARGIAMDIEADTVTEDSVHWRNRDSAAAFLKMHRMGDPTKYKVTINGEEQELKRLTNWK